MKLQHFRIDWKSELSSSTNVFQEVAIIVRVNNEAALVNLYPFVLLDSDHFLKQQNFFNYGCLGNINKGGQWLSGRVLDSRPKGRGFEPHRRHCIVVLEQDTFILA